MSIKAKFFSKRLLAVLVLSAFFVSSFAGTAGLSASAETGHVMTEKEGAGRTIPDGDYYIVNEINQDYFLDIPNDDFNTYNGEGARYWVWNYNGLMPYIEGYDCFHVEYLNNGFYKINQMSTNMCLEYEGGSTEMGRSVQMYEDNGSNAQQWSIEKTSHGYKLRARSSGYYLDVPDGVHKSYTDARCWEGNDSKAQSFSFIPRSPEDYPVAEGDYAITAAADNNSYLTVNGTNVQIENSDSQTLFTFTKDVDGWYKIVEKKSGMVMELADYSDGFLTIPNNVQLAENTSNEVLAKKQLWKLKKNSDGSFFIINKTSGYYLECNHSNTDSDKNVANNMYTGENNQRWFIGLESYTIKYNMNGGSGTIPNQKKIHDKDLILSKVIPERTGYTFLGWNTSKNASAAKYQPGGTYKENASATLYAIWKKKNVSVTAVSLDNNLVKIKSGKTVTLTATVTPSDADNKTLSWSSSNTSAATVSDTGVVTAVSAGTAVITVKSVNGLSDTCKVIVMESALKNTSTVSKTITLGDTINIKGSAIGGTAPYKYEYYFKKSSIAEWSQKKVANTVTSTTITPASAVMYNIKVVVTDSKGNIAESYSDVTVKPKNMVNTSTVPETVSLGDTIKIAASATGGTEPYTYSYYYKKSSNSAWSTKIKDTALPSATIKPSSIAAYNIKVVVTDDEGSTAEKIFNVTVNPAPLVNTSTVTDTITLGENIEIKGSAAGGTAPYKYEYYFKQASAAKWTKKNVEDTVTSTTVKPGAAVAYNIKVIVTDAQGKTAEKVFDVNVNPAPLVNTSTVTNTITLGENIEIKGSAAGGTAPYKYEYYFKQASAAKWTKKNVEDTVTSTTVKPGAAVAYNIKAIVTDAQGKTAEKVFDVNVNPAALVNTSTVTNTITLGENIEIKGSATGGTAPYKYEYYFKQASVSKWTKKNVEDTVTSTTVKPGTAAAYNIKVIVIDAQGKTAEKVFDVNVNPGALVNTSTVTNTITLGENIEIKGSAAGGTTPYKYEYYFKQASVTKWTKKNVEDTVTSTTVKPGTAVPYNIKVVVTDAQGKTDEKEFDVTVEAAPTPLVNETTVSSIVTLGDVINITGAASGGTAPYKYEYYFKKVTQSEWTKKNVEDTVTSTTVKPGAAVPYNIRVLVTDAKGQTAERTYHVTVNEKPDEIEKYTYYFLAPDKYFKPEAGANNEFVGIYWWIPEEVAPWPGIKAEPAPEIGENVFKIVDLPPETTYVIFDNYYYYSWKDDEAWQTDDINTEGYHGDCPYDESVVTDNFNGWIYVMNNNFDILNPVGALAHEGAWFRLDRYKDYEDYYGSYHFDEK